MPEGRAPNVPDIARDAESLIASLRESGYLADTGLATAIMLALKLGRPLLLEGEAGVGKTEVARVLATILNTRLIRLQCYEGIDVHQALYEWDYARQLLHIRLAEATPDGVAEQVEDELFTERFLIRRPLLAALDHAGGEPAVLLIDEIDRADDEFEAFLLEFLSDFAVTVPELGTVRAERPPVVIITSNRTRDLHDALKRRCLYHWIDHPDYEREVAIVRARIPGVPERLAREAAAAVQALRRLELYKRPGVAETLDWVEALVALGADHLEPTTAQNSLGAVLKYHEDQIKAAPQLAAILEAAGDGR
ncbi:MAG: MoxR family ATPase [Dehalococcoidia bacterium]